MIGALSFAPEVAHIDLSSRCPHANCSCSNETDARASISILHNQILRLWRYYRNCLHTCTSIPQITDCCLLRALGTHGLCWIQLTIEKLLAPAVENLSSPCLTGPITDYDWAEGIALMTIFLMFFIELLAARFDVFGDHGDLESSDPSSQLIRAKEKFPSENNLDGSESPPPPYHLPVKVSSGLTAIESLPPSYAKHSFEL